MSDLISRSKVIEEIKKYEYELRKFKKEANESGEIQTLFALANQEIAICKIKRNILNMPTAYDIDKVVEELESKICTIDEDDVEIAIRNKHFRTAIEIVKQGGVSDDACEWKFESDGEFIQNPHTKRLYRNEPSMKNFYCNTCGKKIKAVK